MEGQYVTKDAWLDNEARLHVLFVREVYLEGEDFRHLELIAVDMTLTEEGPVHEIYTIGVGERRE